MIAQSNDPREQWNEEKISTNPRDWGKDDDGENRKFPSDDEQIDDEDWRTDNHHDGA